MEVYFGEKNENGVCFSFSEKIVPQLRVSLHVTQEQAKLTFEAACKKIAKETNEIGFELLGYDFMVDTNLKSWLIEVNTNPCLSTLTQQQNGLIKRLVDDVLRITVDPVFGLEMEEEKTDGYSTHFELLHIYYYTSP